MRWDPYEEIRRLERQMNRLFAEFWGERPRLLGPGKTALKPYEEVGAIEPYTDIQETDKEIIITAEIPGVEKEEIDINATEDRIEISAESKREVEEKEGGYLRRERSYGRYYRSYALPASVTPENAKANYKNGVLEVRLPKKEIKKGTSVKVE
ncbi:MAG: Hsp20/alpha crystallin family protein [Candidatus Hydrothermarchaeales archaeon]